VVPFFVGDHGRHVPPCVLSKDCFRGLDANACSLVASHGQDILVDAASDIQKTIAHSEHPLLELREKYGMSMQRGVIGGAVGYAVARIAKHFALSTLKLTFAGALLYTGAAAFGYVLLSSAAVCAWHRTSISNVYAYDSPALIVLSSQIHSKGPC